MSTHISTDGVKYSETKFSCLDPFNIHTQNKQANGITDALKGRETKRESKKDDNKYV